jgi:hypothetical protein
MTINWFYWGKIPVLHGASLAEQPAARAGEARMDAGSLYREKSIPIALRNDSCLDR